MGRENAEPEMQTMKMAAKIAGHENADNYFDVKYKVLLTDDSNRSTRRRSISGLYTLWCPVKQSLTEPFYVNVIQYAKSLFFLWSISLDSCSDLFAAVSYTHLTLPTNREV